MPWKITDVDSHIKGLSDRQKEVWVKVANTVLRRCLDAGGNEEKCALSAIRQANAVAKNMREGGSMSMILQTEAQRISDRLGLLLEAGRVISAANRAKIEACIEALQELVALSEPKDDGDNEDSEKEVQEAAFKTEDGKAFPASDYAYVPDPDKPSTWKLRLTSTPGGPPDSRIVGAACAALGPGFRGQKVDIPAGDLEKVKAKVRAAWRKANPDRDPDEMPAAIKESAETELLGDCIPLVEKAIRRDGTVPIKIIAPGWGSSGYYPAEVLERDGPKAFPANTQMFWDHPTADEERARPEGSLTTLAGKLVTPARFRENGPAGPGLYADAQIFSPFRERLDELAPHIGVSIRAIGRGKEGEVDGKQGIIVNSLLGAKSVDFVTVPGAGGQIVQLFEAVRRGRAENQMEVTEVDEREAQALREALAELKAENARLKETILLREAKDFVAEVLAKIQMPDLTRARLTESLAAKPPIKDGELDKDAFSASIEEAAKAEVDYLAKISGSGKIHGMGSVPPMEDRMALKESFAVLYQRQGMAKEEAERLAALAVGR